MDEADLLALATMCLQQKQYDLGKKVMGLLGTSGSINADGFQTDGFTDCNEQGFEQHPIGKQQGTIAPSLLYGMYGPRAFASSEHSNEVNLSNAVHLATANHKMHKFLGDDELTYTPAMLPTKGYVVDGDLVHIDLD